MKKYFALFLSVVMLCASLGGCRSVPSVDETTTASEEITTSAPQTTVPTIKPNRQKLRIMYNSTTKSYVETLVGSFTKANGDVSIYLTALDDHADYSQAITDDLNSGNGHDIVLLCPSYILTFNDIALLRSDAFADIDALNAIYPYFDWSDYAQNIISAGVFDGKRKLLPLYYTVPFLIGLEDVLEREKIAYGNGVTLSEFADSLASSPMADFQKRIMIYEMYRYSGLSLVDAYHGIANFGGDELPNLFGLYDMLFPGIYSGKLASYTISNKSDSSALLEESMVFINQLPSNPSFSSLVVLDDYYDEIKTAGRTPVLTAIPDMMGTGVAGSPGWCIAINADTQYPEAAMRFLSHAAGFQYLCDDQTARGIPINNAYNAAVKALYYGEEVVLPQGITMEEFIWKHNNLDHAFLDAYYDILCRVYLPAYVDQTHALTHIGRAHSSYLVDNVPLDTAIGNAKKAIEEKKTQ